MPGPFNNYQAASCKGSHNSYQRDEVLVEQLAWNPAEPAEGGCRAVELDINRKSDGSGGASEGYFQINHHPGGSGSTLASWLKQLLAYHASDVTHDPIFVTLDVKSTQGDASVFPDEIDTYLRTWFDPSIILTPNDVIVDKSLPLLRNVVAHGWPAITSMAGNFLFCLSGNKDWKALYAKTAPLDRLCFADFDVDDDQLSWTFPDDDHRAVVDINLFSAHHSTWAQTIPQMRRDGLVVRAYKLNGEALWKNALAAGVNILATDEIYGKAWATVGTTPYVFL